MKIIHVVGWYYPESVGGSEVYVAALAGRLARLGHAVSIAAPDAVHREERGYQHEGIPVYRFPIPDAPTREEAQGRRPLRGAEKFHSWLGEQRPDVVHVHTLTTGVGLDELRAAKATGARLIVTAHTPALGYLCQRGTMIRWGETACDGICLPTKCAACALDERHLPRTLAWVVGAVPPGVGEVARRLPRKVGSLFGMSALIRWNQERQRTLIALADRFVLLTRVAFDMVLANGAPAAKLALNRLGVSQENLARKPGPDERPTASPVTAGYLGRFVRIKGVLDLAAAFAQLPRDVPIRLDFRGPVHTGEEREVLAEAQSICGRDPRVRFASPVSSSEAVSVLAGYDVLCCPSLWMEGGPTVALEAHAVGTPVIGTRVPGLTEVVTEDAGRRLVAPGDRDALAALLKSLAFDPAGTVDRWRKALGAVRTMDDVTRDYLELYAS